MQYDKNRFKVHSLPHPLVLFWVLFPALIVNELIFGQRQPKVTLIDKESDKPLLERCYIPCPHCETLNDARLWGKRNAFGHWFGFVCPSCHQVIPCLWNVFSLAVLAITFPLWYFPARFFRPRWLEKEKKRLANVLERPLIQAKSINWLLRGTRWIHVRVYGGYSAGVGGFERRRMGLDNDVYWVTNLVGNGLCVGLIHAFFHESKREKDGWS